MGESVGLACFNHPLTIFTGRKLCVPGISDNKSWFDQFTPDQQIFKRLSSGKGFNHAGRIKYQGKSAINQTVKTQCANIAVDISQ